MIGETSAPPRRIRARPLSRATLALQATLIGLALVTIYAFSTFAARPIDMGQALSAMVDNFRMLLIAPRLKNLTPFALLRALMVTVDLGFLTTIFGGVIAFFLGLLAAQNLAPRWASNLVKGGTAFVRAVPTVLWVLFFAVSAGLDELLYQPIEDRPHVTLRIRDLSAARS